MFCFFNKFYCCAREQTKTLHMHDMYSFSQLHSHFSEKFWILDIFQVHGDKFLLFIWKFGFNY